MTASGTAKNISRKILVGTISGQIVRANNNLLASASSPFIHLPGQTVSPSVTYTVTDATPRGAITGTGTVKDNLGTLTVGPSGVFPRCPPTSPRG